MAQAIARAVSIPLHHRGEALAAIARFAIVGGSALAVIMAGPGLPF
ncbi:hypothetical protein [Croceicoccus sp. BE223]|nr:hypothetical protein [Croceicoccus sp. BE223]MDR7100959.1 hypothetical protein [Croceicoccus sp. BE223]